jgi:hypothetical protein
MLRPPSASSNTSAFQWRPELRVGEGQSGDFLLVARRHRPRGKPHARALPAKEVRNVQVTI